MTEEEIVSQEEAIEALMAIPCKIDLKGCDGPWCSARAAIAKVFNCEVVIHEEKKKEEREEAPTPTIPAWKRNTQPKED